MRRHIFSGRASMPPCVLLASLCVVWFIWISLFGALHTQGKTGPAYRAMLDLAPQNVWLLVVAVLACAHVLGITRRRFRRYANFAALMFWTFVATTFFISNPHGLGAPTYTLIAVAAGWAYIRA